MDDPAPTLNAYFLGLNQDYAATLKHMHEQHRAVADSKSAEQLIFVEHSPVITITNQHMHRSIKTSPQAINEAGIALILADRGGDATFHGPGQLVTYPIMRLTHGFNDLEHYLMKLEQSLMEALSLWGIKHALLVPGFRGIWYKSQKSKSAGPMLKKLIAIGVGLKDGVTKHGFALNVSIDHHIYTQHIVPCGLKDRGVITLQEICALEGLHLPDRETMINNLAQFMAQRFAKRLTVL